MQNRFAGRLTVALFTSIALSRDATAQTPTAAPADVATIADIVRVSYETISGPAGQARHWRRDSSLYMRRPPTSR